MDSRPRDWLQLLIILAAGILVAGGILTGKKGAIVIGITIGGAVGYQWIRNGNAKHKRK